MAQCNIKQAGVMLNKEIQWLEDVVERLSFMTDGD